MTFTVQRLLSIIGLGTAFLTMASCGGSGGGSSSSPVVEVVAEGLVVPWNITFFPDGRMMVTERPGRVRLISNGVLDPNPAFTPPDVVSNGEGGLMGMCLHPQFAGNGYVYLCYTNSLLNEKVVRYTLVGNTFTNPTTILDGIPANTNHCGGRIAFGPDGKLYICVGDALNKALSQDLTQLNGKILRVNDDGTIPGDNPFVGSGSDRGEIWTYGNRNAQGIDWDPVTGIMWETENGPSGFDGPEGYDKINVITKGANYGWPIVYGSQTGPGLTPPAYVYVSAVAPSGMAVYRADLLPQFKGHLIAAALVGQALLNLTPNGTSIAAHEKDYLQIYGRLRAVTVGPEGAIYFSTSNEDGRGSPQLGDDKILRIVPGP